MLLEPAEAAGAAGTDGAAGAAGSAAPKQARASPNVRLLRDAVPIALLAAGCRLDLARDPAAALAAACRSADAAGERLGVAVLHGQALPAATLAMVAGAWWCAAPMSATGPAWQRWGLRPAVALALMLPAMDGVMAGARALAEAGGLPWTPHALAASLVVGMLLADLLAGLLRVAPAGKAARVPAGVRSHGRPTR